MREPTKRTGVRPMDAAPGGEAAAFPGSTARKDDMDEDDARGRPGARQGRGGR
jgi:hypothetical protein